MNQTTKNTNRKLTSAWDPEVYFRYTVWKRTNDWAWSVTMCAPTFSVRVASGRTTLGAEIALDIAKQTARDHASGTRADQEGARA